MRYYGGVGNYNSLINDGAFWANGAQEASWVHASPDML